MGLHGFPWRGAEITVFIWCALGGGVGWLGGFVMGGAGKIVRLEELVVGAFGAVIGSELLPMAVHNTTQGFSASGMAGALAGAVIMLILLKVMRSAVGPMQSRKGPGSRRR
jgi:uncharacterized membrane protein YeaQ/YmgE (transglycosylase-associated protein family)